MVRSYKIYYKGRFKAFTNFTKATELYYKMNRDGKDVLMVTEHYCIFDRFFESCGLSREDFDMIIKLGKSKYLVPSLSVVWWILTTLMMTISILGLWSFVVLMIIFFR